MFSYSMFDTLNPI